MKTLAQCVEDMRLTRKAHLDACRAAWLMLLSRQPEVGALLIELGLDAEISGPLFWTAKFDGNERSAIELFEEGRGSEVIARVRRMVHGVF